MIYSNGKATHPSSLPQGDDVVREMLTTARSKLLTIVKGWYVKLSIAQTV